MPTAIINGITTRYEVVGSGPPVLMFSPGGFDASLEKWSTLGVYARTKLLDGLSAIDSDTARLAFTRPGKAVLITGKPGPEGETDFRYLLMPIRLGT